MINKLAPYPPTGFVSTNLIGQRALDERFNPNRPFDRKPCQTSTPELDWGRYSQGVRDTKERLHGEAFFALTVGLLAGTFAGVIYRELGMALAGVLGY